MDGTKVSDCLPDVGCSLSYNYIFGCRAIFSCSFSIKERSRTACFTPFSFSTPFCDFHSDNVDITVKQEEGFTGRPWII
jgi:hypothetical protein